MTDFVKDAINSNKLPNHVFCCPHQDDQYGEVEFREKITKWLKKNVMDYNHVGWWEKIEKLGLVLPISTVRLYGEPLAQANVRKKTKNGSFKEEYAKIMVDIDVFRSLMKQMILPIGSLEEKDEKFCYVLKSQEYDKECSKPINKRDVKLMKDLILDVVVDTPCDALRCFMQFCLANESDSWKYGEYLYVLDDICAFRNRIVLREPLKKIGQLKEKAEKAANALSNSSENDDKNAKVNDELVSELVKLRRSSINSGDFISNCESLQKFVDNYRFMFNDSWQCKVSDEMKFDKLEKFENNIKNIALVKGYWNPNVNSSKNKDTYTEAKEEKGKEKQPKKLQEKQQEKQQEKEKTKNIGQTIKNPFVVIVGSEDYNASEYESLDGVKHDVLRMVRLWKDIYGYNDISIVFNPNNESDKNKSKDILEKLERYKEHFNYPYKKKTDSSRILENEQSFQDYLVKIRSKIEDNESNDSLIFYYSGHGIKDKIVLSNGKPFAIRRIVDTFDGKQCVQLRNTPKIMIYDCCRGSQVSQSYKNVNEANKIGKIRGNAEHDDMYHANSGLATIFSNFSGCSINDSSQGGHLTRAIEKIFENPKSIEKESLRDLIIEIRKTTKLNAGKGDKDLNWSAQLVDFHETLENKVYLTQNENN